MKARLIKKDDEYQLLTVNGQIRNVSFKEIRKFFSTYKNENLHYNNGEWNYDVSIDNFNGETLATVNDDLVLVIHNESFLGDLLYNNPIEYVSVVVYAEMHGKNPLVVRRLCAAHRIPGVIGTGNSWMIPEDAPYPPHGHTKQK